MMIANRNRRRVRVFALVCGAFAFAAAITVVALGSRTTLTWLLLFGTLESLAFQLWSWKQEGPAAG